MKKLIFTALAVFGILVLYLAFAPVPIDPESWDVPENKGYSGVFAANDKLSNLERIDLSKSPGPEDVTALNGFIYATSQTGDITKIDPQSGDVEILANTGGVPLGIEASGGTLYIADAYKGLFALTTDGALSLLTDRVDDTPILYADDLDIAPEGIIYFSDASTKFGAENIGSTMDASLLEIMESVGTGRVLAYNLLDKTTSVVKDGLVFPNGVAIHPDGDILVNETGRYRVLKINPKTGASVEFIGNLPGFPDNINPGPDGTFLLGIISPRSDWLDQNASKPSMRKLAMRLPASLRPQAEDYVHIVQLDQNGQVLQSLQDPKGAYHHATGAIVHDGYIYVTSLFETALARQAFP